jgi:cytochrome o ubiquinol oxidase subunit 3
MHEALPDSHQDTNAKTFFGFWLYLMTDCVMFATFFATYAVLSGGTAGGPSAKDLFHLPFVLTETLVLLTSSFTCGLAMLPDHFERKYQMLGWFALTFLLGLLFLWMEGAEFSRLIQEGNGWQRSAFLTAYFTLIGTHGLHMVVGLLWMIVLLIPVWRHGLNPVSFRRLTCLRLFWHFLYLIWIFTFTFVYLTGVK